MTGAAGAIAARLAALVPVLGDDTAAHPGDKSCHVYCHPRPEAQA